jgi:hypothetical protein
MARVADAQMNASGLYRFLERQERANYENWEQGQERRVYNGYSREGYPRQRRLDAFAAGLAVNVDAGDILGLGALRDGAPIVPRPVGHRLRAIVSPADMVTWSDDDWARLWLEELGEI